MAVTNLHHSQQVGPIKDDDALTEQVSAAIEQTSPKSGFPSLWYTGEIGGYGNISFDDHCGVSSGQDVNWALGSDLFVRSITVWHNNDYTGIYGVKLSYWNNTQTPLRGSQARTTDVLYLARGETITRAVLWGNGSGDRCGRIQLWTSLGQTFDVGKDTSGQTSYELSVSGGHLLGVFGQTWDATDAQPNCLGLVFLGEVNSVTVSNLTYNSGFDNFGQISQVNLAQAKYDNTNGVNPTTFTFSDTMSKTSSWSVTQSTTLTFGTSITIKASVPEVVDVEATFSFQVSATETTESTNTSEQALEYSVSGSLNVGQAVLCKAITMTGVLSQVPYHSDVAVVFKEGTTWNFSESGVFSGVSYTDCWTTMTPA